MATSVLLKTRVPIGKLIKYTVFRQFCGGESVKESLESVHELQRFKVFSILDYSAEGKNSEDAFNRAARKIEKTIHQSAQDPAISFSVFKPTAIGSAELLEKVARRAAASTNSLHSLTLNDEEERQWQAFRQRFEHLCRAAVDLNTRIFVDAEESWYQDVIDELTTEMMRKFNRDRALVYNTLQMYRHDRLDYLYDAHKAASAGGYHIGLKLVRGAYMEKERLRAEEMGYPSPIHDNKDATDIDYDLAIEYCVKNIDTISFCAGTHNEQSTLHLIAMLEKYKISSTDHRAEFAQLLGMSDHLTFNLASAGFLASKYVPYGPVREVMPYLLRRVDENTSIAGQMSRELKLILIEQQRRHGK